MVFIVVFSWVFWVGVRLNGRNELKLYRNVVFGLM